MSKLITKKRFIEAIENNDAGLTNQELATSMGISEPYFYDLRRKYRDQIRDITREMAKERAARNMNNLQRNSDRGDTKAALALLEIAEVYIPSSRQRIDTNVNKEDLGVIMFPVKRTLLKPDEEIKQDAEDKPQIKF